jgi:hypothetical protein
MFFFKFIEIPQLAENKTPLVVDVAVGTLSYYELMLQNYKMVKRRNYILRMIIIFNGYRDGYGIQVRMLFSPSFENKTL